MKYFGEEPTKPLANAYAFEQIVGKILRYNYNLKDTSANVPFRYDFLTENDINIEVKYSSRSDSAQFAASIRRYIDKLSDKELEKTIFVANVRNTESLPDKLYAFDGKAVRIISLENLLYLCGDNDLLRAELTKCLNFSTETVAPRKLEPNVESLLSGCKKEKVISENKKSFESQLPDIARGKKDFPKFEKLCTEFVSTIFQDSLEEPLVQKSNNKRIYRFDMVAAIKENPISFWKFIYDKFNSCFILFECKNYKGKIGQNEIYSTEKYLYDNALRNVAVIISRDGMDGNAGIACQGILREHGKMILVLCDEDLKLMEKTYNDRKKDAGLPSPSDYLYKKAKDFLLNLDK